MKDGEHLLQVAIEMVVRELRAHPGGLSNAEIGHRTGLFLEVPDHSGYISWTILQHLVHTGRAVKDREIYRLK
jgi:hypothetical protein